jgi:hypothetical protein
MGMSAGMSAHHSWGFAARREAAMSMAATIHKRTAILRAHKPSGNVCMEISPCKNFARSSAKPRTPTDAPPDCLRC